MHFYYYILYITYITLPEVYFKMLWMVQDTTVEVHEKNALKLVREVHTATSVSTGPSTN